MPLSEPGPLRLVTHDDPVDFAAVALPFLEQHEAENGLVLGVLATARVTRPAPLFMALVARDGEPVLVAVRGELDLVVSPGPDAAVDFLVAELAALPAGPAFPGVIGPAREAERFARVWEEARQCRAVLTIDQRLYRLTKVTWPARVPGRMRAITGAELEVAGALLYGFDAEAFPHERHDPAAARRRAERRIGDGTLFGWEVAGQLVSIAGLARPTPRGIAVNSVYTPPEHRRRGYATALVAAVSQAGLDCGKAFCVLYTDATNPTSNAIYQRIGYELVCDSRSYRFEPDLSRSASPATA